MSNQRTAPNTVDVYGRALDDYLRFCAAAQIRTAIAKADVVAAWIADMRSRPNPQCANTSRLYSRVGLAVSTIQQRLVAVRGSTPT